MDGCTFLSQTNCVTARFVTAAVDSCANTGEADDADGGDDDDDGLFRNGATRGVSIEAGKFVNGKSFKFSALSTALIPTR